MSTAAPLAAPARAMARAGRRPLWERLALPVVAALGAANFLWQLGSSSYYVDEIQSIGAAAEPLAHVLHAVARTELTPPAYFFFLHEWLLRTGSRSEAVARLPSAACGVALVCGVYWLASTATSRRGVALGAAALTAFSPFVLEFAQRAQGYVFLMLAITVSAAAVLEAEHAAESARVRWLALGAAAAALSLWLHYTAGFVIALLSLWVLTRRRFTLAQRGAFVGVCGLAAAGLIPVLLAQHRAIPVRTGVAAAAGVTGTNVERVLATPLDGRVDAILPLAVIVTLGALVLLMTARANTVRARALLLGIALGEPLALVVLSALGAHLMLTRYAAVSAPFAIVAIVASIASSPRPLAVLLAAGAACVAVAGIARSHQQTGFYLDARRVVSYLNGHAQAADAVIAPVDPGAAVPLVYYGLTRFHPQWVGAAPAPIPRAERIWVISQVPAPVPGASQLLSVIRRSLRPVGYTALQVTMFPSISTLAVVLEAPLR